MVAISTDLIPYEHAAVDISSGDFDCTDLRLGYAREVFVGTGGDGTSLFLKFLGDDNFEEYKNVPSGSFVCGAIIAIGESSTTNDMIVRA